MNSSYSSDFKQKTVKLFAESDQSVAHTARDLGANANTLYAWITKYHQADSPINKGSAEKHPYEELKQLRKENARLKEERVILKKAAA